MSRRTDPGSIIPPADVVRESLTEARRRASTSHFCSVSRKASKSSARLLPLKTQPHPIRPVASSRKSSRGKSGHRVIATR